jgi:fido (protein-threonine AMPylation protein)
LDFRRGAFTPDIGGVFRSYRLRKVHARFLSACRNLREGRALGESASRPSRWLLQLFAPASPPIVQDEDQLLLSALEWLEANCKTRPLGEPVIQQYHRLATAGDRWKAGEYRTDDLLWDRSPVRFRLARRILPDMRALDARLARVQACLDKGGCGDQEELLKIAAEIHHELGAIHPFDDANGRVVLLSMNHFLRRYDMGYVVYPPLHESDEVWEALLDANRGNLTPLMNCAKKFLNRV